MALNLKINERIQIGKYQCWIKNVNSSFLSINCNFGYTPVFMQFGITMEDINKRFETNQSMYPDFDTLEKANKFIEYLLTFDKKHITLWI